MSTSSGDSEKLLGELVPQGGGDPIPLRKERLIVGRRESCDIILRFGNVSSNHCELTLESGYWFVKDLGSRNGTRLNGYRISKKRMDPGDTLSIAKRDYKAKYSPAELGAEGPPPDVDVMVEIMSQSLLEGAGLARKGRQEREGRIGVKKQERGSSSGTAGPAADQDDDSSADDPFNDPPATPPSADESAADESAAGTSAATPAGAAPPEAPADKLSDQLPEQMAGTDDDEEPDEYRLAPE